MTAVTSDAQTYDCRKAFAEQLIELAHEDDRIVAVCNDSVGSSNVGFRETFPAGSSTSASPSRTRRRRRRTGQRRTHPLRRRRPFPTGRAWSRSRPTPPTATCP